VANLNVLPQVSAKPSTPNGVKGEVSKETSSGKVLAQEFQKDLHQASEKPAGLTDKNKAELEKLALQSSEKEATEKAAALALQGAGVKPELPLAVPAKGEAQPKEANALKGGSPLNAKAGPEQAKANLIQEQLKTAKNPAELQTQAHADARADEQMQKLVEASGGSKGQLNHSELASMMSGEAQAGAGVKNGASLKALSDEHAFDLESMDVKEGSSASGIASQSLSDHAGRVPSSKLSTSDYMNLRDLSQHSAKPVVTRDAISAQNPSLQASNLSSLTSAGIGMKAATLSSANAKDKKPGAANEAAPGSVIAFDRGTHSFNGKTIDAPVTQGSNQKIILSHDAVHQISNHVNLLSQAKQDGEIKIRLRPDHLGEMQMSVRTQGNAVSIQIKAQDGEAKKIIEESLGSLRDSLSQQNLTLGRVDVVTQSPQAQNDQGMQMDMNQQQFRQNHDQSGFNNQEQNARQDRFFEDQAKPVNLNAGRAAQMSAVRSRAGSANGLDMIA
jgi:flagellar hook-length control protein FliK